MLGFNVGNRLAFIPKGGLFFTLKTNSQNIFYDSDNIQTSIETNKKISFSSGIIINLELKYSINKYFDAFIFGGISYEIFSPKITWVQDYSIASSIGLRYTF
jgi:hypothetical protein